MSIFHFKAVLQGQDEEGSYIYMYYPDHVMAENVQGLFRVDPQTFEYEIIERAEAEERGLVSTDEHCVSATLHKIKMAQEKCGEMPKEVFWIA